MLFELYPGNPARKIACKREELDPELPRYLCLTDTLPNVFGELDVLVVHVCDVHVIHYL